MTGVAKAEVAAFMVAIVLMGVLRFCLTVGGVSDQVTRYASMTVVILAGCVYFGTRRLPWRESLAASYLLILPYMTIEVAALGYTWATGRATIFHSPAHSLGMPVSLHFWGHLAGGLTWEPLFLFLVILFVRTVSARWASPPGPPSPPFQ